MFNLSLVGCQQPLAGKLVGNDVPLSGFSIDTRTLQAGDLYIAIHGAQFDGHDFVAEAERCGASALLVHRPVVSNLPQLQVADTRVALGELARIWAQGHALPVIAVTGSNGKTTLKEIIATILQQLGPVLATRGNLNNDIGVPLTLLRLRPEHQYAVLELGANHAGEIAALSKLVNPDVAVVNNIGPVHLEGFGSIAAVAAAKAEIFGGLKACGTAVINADDAFSPELREAATDRQVCTFGVNDAADVHGEIDSGLSIQIQGQTLRPAFRLPGRHNRMNALAAVAAVRCLGIDTQVIVKGLEQVAAVSGRLEFKHGMAGATLIDDSYNANSVSAQTAIDVLCESGGSRHLVLGDMLELGDDAASLHAGVGTYARQCGIENLWSVGELAAHATRAFGSSHHYDNQQPLIDELLPVLDADTTVLVKGSRGSHMERVVHALLARPNLSGAAS